MSAWDVADDEAFLDLLWGRMRKHPEYWAILGSITLIVLVLLS